LAALLLGAPLAHSQSVCSSDDQASPTALFERFINADCESCWSNPTTQLAAPGALALDWIMPGSLGDEAPLAAAASRDALMRLDALHHAPPKTQSTLATTVAGWPGAALRVAHGMAVGGYVGASIELTLPAGATPELPLQAWLVLVETLPKNFEGSPVARNLVRNVLQPAWNMREELQKSEQLNFKETRPMNIPQGATPAHLRVLGWVTDAKGRVLAAAESTCPPEDKE
jgi:hypothetical protein